jgi:hypothetical protein
MAYSRTVGAGAGASLGLVGALETHQTSFVGAGVFGAGVGTLDGTRLGTGLTVGWELGDIVGKLVGMMEGTGDGTCVGIFDGN